MKCLTTCHQYFSCAEKIFTVLSCTLTLLTWPSPFRERAFVPGDKMSWRTFKFFEFEELKDPDSNQAYDKLKAST